MLTRTRIAKAEITQPATSLLWTFGLRIKLSALCPCALSQLTISQSRP